MFCAIWYHLYNLKNVKNPYEGVTFGKVAGVLVWGNFGSQFIKHSF